MRSVQAGTRADARRSTTRWMTVTALALSAATSRAARADGAGDAVADATADAEDDPYHTLVVYDPATSPRASQDEAASSSVVTPDRTPRSAETLPDLLDDLPGVSVSRLGGVGASALLSLRGSSWDQVSVYLDGVNLNMAAGGGVDLGTVPIGDVARVEVYRGVTPLAFGGSAIGGVLSVETRRPRVNAATAELGGGSFGTWLGSATGSLAGERYGLYAGLHGLRSAGDFQYVDDKGTAFDPKDDERVARSNNRLGQIDGVVRGFVALPGKRELSLMALGVGRGQGLAGYPRYPTMRSHLRTRRGVATLAYESRRELGESSWLRAQVYGHGLEQRFTDPLGEVAAGGADARDRTLAFGATARAKWFPTEWVQPALLLDARRESFVPYDLEADQRGVVSTRLVGVVGAEAALRVDAAHLVVLPSLRVETSRDRAAGRGSLGELVTAGDPVTRALPVARLAVTQSPDEHVVLRANLGRYARLPSFLELFGNTGFIRGNRDLVPEHGTSGDVGAAVDVSRRDLGLTVDGALFGVFTDDLIQFEQNAYGVATAFNLGRARILGAEASAAARAGHGRLFAQATFTDARDRSDRAASRDKQLPYRPRAHVTVRPELRGLPLFGVRFGAHVEVDVTSGNYIDPSNLVVVPSRLLIGAGMALGWDDDRIRLIATASNLTGAAESDVLAYPLPGRAFYLSLAFSTERQPKEP